MDAYFRDMNALVLCALCAWGPPEWPDSLHVAAVPFLNVRSADLGQIHNELPDGTPIATHRLAHTGRRDTISGLPGEWLALDDTLRIFDAYLWPADPPRREEYENEAGPVVVGEWWGDYILRVVDGLHVARAYSVHEDYGGPSGESYGADIFCTSGQALNLFRRLLRARFQFPLNQEDERQQLERILNGSWDGEEPLALSWGSEGGGSTLVLKRSDRVDGAFCIEHSMGTC